jgi:hypothetical protein
VIWIVEENRSRPRVANDPQLPYFHAIEAACGVATNYHNTSHSSLPNYIALTSGTERGPAVSHDAHSTRGFIQTQENIFHQLDMRRAGGWGAYAEGMPANCSSKDKMSSDYAVRHNPVPFYRDLLGGGSGSSCAKHDVPLGLPTAGRGNDLYTALYANGGGGLPSFSLIIPNLCNDMHGMRGVCTTRTHPTKSEDANAWLRAWLPTILASPNYVAGNTAIFIVWDEGEPWTTAGPSCWSIVTQSNSNGCWTEAIIISPSTPRGARSPATEAFNHYDLLVATERLLGLDPNKLDWSQATGRPDGNSLISAFNL